MYKLPKRLTLRLMSCILIFSPSFLTTAYEMSVTTNKKVTINVLNSKQAPLQNMVVYLEPLEHSVNIKNDVTLEVGQKNKSFIPYISVMQLGSLVKFNNKDNITHHIYSPVGDNKFSVKIRSGQQIIKDTFNQVGEVSMGCNIHDWMSGYMLIVDTPYFAQTDNNGNATLSIEKTGRYNVVVWHPQMNEADNKITKTIHLDAHSKIIMQLSEPMDEIPTQQNEDDFDFLSDY